MVKTHFFALLSILFIGGCSIKSNAPHPDEILNVDSLNLVPFPVSIEKNEGFFELNSTVLYTLNDHNEAEANYLQNLFSERLIHNGESVHRANAPTINIRYAQIFSKNPEAYELEIRENHINIMSAHNSGLMRGMQTLRQLFIPAFHQNEQRESWYLPALTIKDEPRFKHRGMLLDVCRHYFEKDVVLKYIDALAYFKMNVLHFHLTEDQGWRLPVEKYPLLNKISSWRPDSSGNQYGGFYTKEELKEIVAYASERHITVIPEIELPGHSQAALAAYPQFSCNGGPIEVATDWGVFKEIYCAGNDSTFIFIEDILKEVMEIFPSEYIHIGGDEAPKFRWEHCSRCQKRMKAEGLADEHELQSYFIRRIETFLNENGRQLIGWDEILEGGLSENAAVQSWRGFDGGLAAARQKHEVIMSPTSHCYLDYGLASIDLRKIYEFDPIPPQLEEEYHPFILGGEGNMWTEHVPNEENLDSKVFPRIIGLSEVLWSYPQNRDFENFYSRLQNHYSVLSAMNISYGPETIGAFIEEDFSSDQIQINLNKNLPDLTLKYKWGSKYEFIDYTSPIPLNKTGKLTIQAFKNGETYGDEVTQYFVHHKALNKVVTYNTQYNQWYEGNKNKNLVDGKMGSLDFRDGNWQGFWGEDLNIIIDLGSITEANTLSADFYQYANSWIFIPPKMTIKYSADSLNWTEQTYTYNDVDLSNKKSIARFDFDLMQSGESKSSPAEIRYIQVEVENFGKVPEGHEAAGSNAWLFIDEIILQ